jgi:hypothetical protein
LNFFGSEKISSDWFKISRMTKQQNIEKFYWDEHVNYIINLDKNEENTFEFYVTEHLKMSACLFLSKIKLKCTGAVVAWIV